MHAGLHRHRFGRVRICVRASPSIDAFQVVTVDSGPVSPKVRRPGSRIQIRVRTKRVTNAKDSKLSLLAVDQVLMSSSPVVATAMATHAAGSAGAAVMLVFQALYVLGLATTRVLFTEPLLTASNSLAAQATRHLGRMSAIATCASAAAMLIAIASGHNLLGLGFGLFGVSLVQDSARMILIRSSRYGRIAAADGMVAGGLFFGLLLQSADLIVILWVALLVASASVMWLGARAGDPSIHRISIGAYLRALAASSVDSASAVLATQIPLLIVAGVWGHAESGSLRVTLVVVGPVTTVAAMFSLAAGPRIAEGRLTDHSRRRIVVTLAGFSATYMLIVITAKDVIGRVIFSNAVDLSSIVLILFGIASILTAMSVLYVLKARAIGRASLLASLRAPLAIATVAFVVMFRHRLSTVSLGIVFLTYGVAALIAAMWSSARDRDRLPAPQPVNSD